MKRHVFEKLKSHPAVRSFANDIGLDASLNQHMKTYFDTAVRENRYYSEDWTFCENWRDLGGQVWVDKRVLLRHVGTHTFDFASQDKLYDELKAVVEPTRQAAQLEAADAAALPSGNVTIPITDATTPVSQVLDVSPSRETVTA